jgi:hypothetical protein
MALLFLICLRHQAQPCGTYQFPITCGSQKYIQKGQFFKCLNAFTNTLSQIHIQPVLSFSVIAAAGSKTFRFKPAFPTSQSLDMTFSRALQLEAAKTYPNKAIPCTVVAQRGITTLNLAMPSWLIHDVTRRIGISSRYSRRSSPATHLCEFKTPPVPT